MTDRDGGVEEAGSDGHRPDPADPFALPSRAEVLERCRSALLAGTGPVLLTGEPGAGKTWLWRRLAVDLAGRYSVLGLDLAPSTDADGLFRMIGHGLGIGSTGDPRLRLADHLQERSQDGRRWVLVLDEAHNLVDEVLEEVRLLSNRLAQPDGFAGLLLVGQTALARRIGQRSQAGLSARLAARLHLRPIDADEAQTLLSRRWPGRFWDRAEVDYHHRDAAGNPGRLLRIVQALDQTLVPAAGTSLVRPETRSGRRLLSPTFPFPAITRNGEETEKAPTLPHPPAAPEPVPFDEVPASRPLLGEDRPPIHEEDGLIEVGWEPQTPAALEPAAPSEPEPGRPAEPEEEVVGDHYAALQAWNEWAENQGRSLAPAAGARAEGSGPLAGSPNLWADGPESFAPYSQLFSRLKQPRKPD